MVIDEKRITHVIVHHMITYASLRTKMSYKYRQMSKLCIYWRKENFRQQGVVFVGGDSVSSQSKSHCFPDHKIELFLWCHRHRHASMSYVLVRRFIVRELHLIARKLLFSILDTHIRINLFIIEIDFLCIVIDQPFVSFIFQNYSM